MLFKMVRTTTGISCDAPKRHGDRIPGAYAYLYNLVSQFRQINRVWDAANQYRGIAAWERKDRDTAKLYFVQKCRNNNKNQTVNQLLINLWKSVKNYGEQNLESLN